MHGPAILKIRIGDFYAGNGRTVSAHKSKKSPAVIQVELHHCRKTSRRSALVNIYIDDGIRPKIESESTHTGGKIKVGCGHASHCTNALI